MVGFVVVSHSEKVAQGVKEICKQFNDEGSYIIDAGGIEDRIGTDVIKIKEAIETAHTHSNNILLFGDIGSSILSAETAVELLEEDIREKVTIVDAPLVEGMIVAVVTASITEDIDVIIKEAQKTKSTNKF